MGKNKNKNKKNKVKGAEAPVLSTQFSDAGEATVADVVAGPVPALKSLTPGEKVAQLLKGAAYISELQFPQTSNDLHAASVLNNVLKVAEPFADGKTGGFSQLEKQILKNEMKEIERVINLITPRSNMNLIETLKETGLASRFRVQQPGAEIVELGARQVA